MWVCVGLTADPLTGHSCNPHTDRGYNTGVSIQVTGHRRTDTEVSTAGYLREGWVCVCVLSIIYIGLVESKSGGRRRPLVCCVLHPGHPVTD